MSIREYLTFTRRERIGIAALVALLLIIAVLPHFISRPLPTPEDVALDGIQKGAPQYAPPEDSRGESAEKSGYRQRDIPGRYYTDYGDAEGSSAAYIKKGWSKKNDGGFRSDSAFFGRRKYWQDHSRNNFVDGKPYPYHDAHKIYKDYTDNYARYHKLYYQAVDINAADTAAFISLPGIGSKLAARIVSFRDKLGGFQKVDQIREVYGLRDSVFLTLVPYLKCDSAYKRKALLTYNLTR